ncbi:hypothetical protein CI102_10753 [Trichoderma harzianum]|nr:hypothetical protein CI102_10753 [Trichoderma harzianum]
MDSTELFTSGRKISNDLLQLVVLFQLRQSPNYRHLVAEEQRFQLWAHSLGLYQQGHASLDYRVRDAEIVKSGFARILEELQTHVGCTFKCRLVIASVFKSNLYTPSSVLNSIACHHVERCLIVIIDRESSRDRT